MLQVVGRDWLWREEWGRGSGLQPYSLACPLQHTAALYTAVSLVSGPACSRATNLLRLAPPPAQQAKQDFAVCVKPLSFPHQNVAAQLAEWLETLLLLGVWRSVVHSKRGNIM